MATVTIVSSHFRENLAWLTNQTKYPYRIYSKTSADYDKFLPTNNGGEAEAYLNYIVDAYDDLPTHCIFVHGHEHDWHQQGSVLESIERAGPLTDDMKYKNINKPDVCWNLMVFRDERLPDHVYNFGNKFCYQIFSNPTELEMYKFLFGDNLPRYIFSKGCAQFIVHRDLIRSRPKRYWADLLARMYALGQRFEPDKKRMAYVFEYTFFWVMTQQEDEYVWK